jgi:hypothetical protein
VILARNFFVEIRGQAQRKKRGAKERKAGGHCGRQSVGSFTTANALLAFSNANEGRLSEHATTHDLAFLQRKHLQLLHSHGEQFGAKIKRRTNSMKTFSFVLAGFALLLRVCCAQEAWVAVPEAGFISPDKYTNAFFGFSLPLPQDAAFRRFQLPSNGAGHSLFGLRAQKKGLTAFTIVATQMNGASSEQARKAASEPKAQNIKKTEVDGKEFWRGESQEKSSAGKMWSITYVTAINGYLLKFLIVSFDAKLTEDLQHCIEAAKFFDPAKAQEAAGSNSLAYNPMAPRNSNPLVAPSSNRIGQLSAGVVSGNAYKNDALGFTYEFPPGWVVNDKAIQDKVMEAGHQFAWGDSPSAAREHAAFQQCARVLLMATKYPEGTKTEGYNPLVTVIAVDSACAPGAHFPISIDDHDAIKEAAQQLVRSFAGTPFISKGNNSVRAFVVQGHVMLDISGSFQVNPPGSNTPLDIYTSIDFTQVNGYLVGWGFVSGSQSGLQELKNTKIAFASN